MLKSRTSKVVVLSSGNILTTLVTLFFAMFLARVFNKEDYSTYRQTFFVYNLLFPFLSMALPTALFYFLPVEDNKRKVLTENLFMLFVGGLLFAFFTFSIGADIFSDKFHNPALKSTLKTLSVYGIFMFPASAFSAAVLSCDRAEVVAIFNLISRIFILMFVIFIVLLKKNVFSAVASRVLAGVMVSSAAIMVMYSVCKEGSLSITAHGMKNQLFYSFPVGLSRIVGRFSKDIDKLVVSTLTSPSIFATYINGAMDIPFISIVTGSVTSVLLVDYARLYKENRVKQMVELIHRAMFKSGLILIPLMFFFMLEAKDIMIILYGYKYADSASVFRVYLLLLPARTLTFGAILRSVGKTWPILGQPLLTLPINAFFSWLLVKQYGALWAAIVTILTTYLIAIPYYVYWVSKSLNVSSRILFPWKKMAMVFLASLAVFALAFIVFYFITKQALIVRFVIVSVVFGISLLWIYYRVGWLMELPYISKIKWLNIG